MAGGGKTLMPLVTNLPAAWICVLAGTVLLTAVLALSLKRQGRLTGRTAAVCLLPAVLGLLLAKGGYVLLQWEDNYASFPWCFSTGLLGLTAGTALAARLAGGSIADTLDDCAAALCLAMACARLSQRWLGLTGIGPILDETGFYAMINDWEEPVLATWMIETAACLAAAGITALRGRKKEGRVPGGSLCLALFLLMIPQILTEQFRSGAYLSFMMMRLEQVLFALIALGALLYLCAVLRRKNAMRLPGVILTLAAFFLMLGFIALLQFILDGKVADWPAGLCWGLYGLTIAGVLGLCIGILRWADRAYGFSQTSGAESTNRADEGKEQTGK